MAYHSLDTDGRAYQSFDTDGRRALYRFDSYVATYLELPVWYVHSCLKEAERNRSSGDQNVLHSCVHEVCIHVQIAQHIKSFVYTDHLGDIELH